MRRAAVLGIDSSTQSVKVLAIDLESGRSLAEGRAPHTGRDTQDPRHWWQAMQLAVSRLPLERFSIEGLSVAAQQHGLVTLDEAGVPVRAAPLWNNTEAAIDADRLNELADFALETGSRLVASFTIAKLAHLQRTNPEDLYRTAVVCLPHDFLNLKLTGEMTTDRGDASGSGWFSPFTNVMRRDLIALAVGEDHATRLNLPRLVPPDQSAGLLSDSAAQFLGLPAGIPVAAGTGDNPAAGLGLAVTTGEFVVSLGTSGTAYAVSDFGTTDRSGEVAGFADATGKFMPLSCMLNCTKVFESVATMLGLPLEHALDIAAQVMPGAGGLLAMPYMAGERTPNLPHATGSLEGMTSDNLTPANMLRAAIDGVSAGLAYCIGALQRQGLVADRVVLAGGGSNHTTWQQAIADATQMLVQVRAGGEHVARGAAIQAAAVVMNRTVQNVANEWRPAILSETMPRSFDGDPFQMERRSQLANAMASATKSSGT